MTLRFSHPARRKSLFPICSYGGSWLLLTLWLRLCLPETLMGWERHQLFRFSAEYLTFFTTRPYPVLLYVQAFFTQFYLYPLLGAAVIAGLLTLGIGAWHRLTGRFWTGLIWAALMLPLLSYFHLLWLLTWLVILGGTCLLTAGRHWPQTGRWGLTAGLAFAAAWILQENVLWAVLFWGLTIGINLRSARHSLYGLVAGTVGAALGIGLLVWIGYPFYYRQFLMQWQLLNPFFWQLHDFPTNLLSMPPVIMAWVYAGLGVSFLLPWMASLSQHITNRTSASGQAPTAERSKRLSSRRSLSAPWRHNLRRGAGILLLITLWLGSLFLNLRYQMEDFFLVDRLESTYHWAEAREAAELAFFQRARPEAVQGIRHHFLRDQRHRSKTAAGRLGIRPEAFLSSEEECFMADMLKIALLGDRQATSRLFAYNGSYYFPLLFPNNILDAASSYVMARYYTSQGYYAEALHLLYDFVTCKRISTAVLEPLLWNSVVTGDYVPCRKFIRFFEQSLFHRDIARRYTAYLADTAATAQRPEVAAARTLLSSHNHTVAAYMPDLNTQFRLRHEADNATVYEYALCLWMIHKNHPRILQEWPKIRRYYTTPPIHLQEALLTNFTPDMMADLPEGLTPGIVERYVDFFQMHMMYQNGYVSFRKIQQGFEDTYWFHLVFNDFKSINEMFSNTETVNAAPSAIAAGLPDADLPATGAIAPALTPAVDAKTGPSIQVPDGKKGSSI